MNTIMLRTALALCFTFCAAGVHASVKISSDPTKNMSCVAGVCSPTAKDAVLNVDDLTNMLASADVTVKSGGRAVTIGVLSPLAWASTHRLTLEAEFNVHIKAPVTVEGTAGLTIIANDGGSGDLMTYPGGKIAFWDTKSSLIINGKSYVLAADISTLSKDIAANRRGAGFFALANDITQHHKKFRSPPIRKFNAGIFEGLGNSITGVRVGGSYNGCAGFFAQAGVYFDPSRTVIRDINLKDIRIDPGRATGVGGLVGCNEALVVNASVDGSVVAYGGYVGGLVGSNFSGDIVRSRSAASVQADSSSVVGGLVGYGFRNSSYYGSIDQSFATGAVSGNMAGGLIGENDGPVITNSYSTGTVTLNGPSSAGGFAGQLTEAQPGTVSSSYSTGLISGGSGALGGFLGADETAGGRIDNTYWDLDTSGIGDPSQGAGNIPNDPGITGLTDAQLKSGLPAGFDPKIWAQSPGINDGYPYLIANPPPQ